MKGAAANSAERRTAELPLRCFYRIYAYRRTDATAEQMSAMRASAIAIAMRSQTNGKRNDAPMGSNDRMILPVLA